LWSYAHLHPDFLAAPRGKRYNFREQGHPSNSEDNMHSRTCLLAVAIGFLWAVAGPSQRCFSLDRDVPGTVPVLQQNDDLEPLPLDPAAKEAEQDAAAKLRKSKYFVVTEQPDSRVTSVNFMGAKVDDEAFKQTAKLCRVSTVNADGSNVTDDLLKHLSGLTSMTSLVLSNTPITDKGIVHLRPLPKLQALYLSKTKLSDAGLDDVAQIKNLRILNLSQTKVTDEGMKKLLPLAKLNWLLLSETDLTDVGLKQLAEMKQLRRLTITKTKVTPEGISRLKEAIPHLSIDK
jgi:hypothetical protein